MYLLLKMVVFHCHVSLPEGTSFGGITGANPPQKTHRGPQAAVEYGFVSSTLSLQSCLTTHKRTRGPETWSSSRERPMGHMGTNGILGFLNHQPVSTNAVGFLAKIHHPNPRGNFTTGVLLFPATSSWLLFRILPRRLTARTWKRWYPKGISKLPGADFQVPC